MQNTVAQLFLHAAPSSSAAVFFGDKWRDFLGFVAVRSRPPFYYDPDAPDGFGLAAPPEPGDGPEPDGDAAGVAATDEAAAQTAAQAAAEAAAGHVEWAHAHSDFNLDLPQLRSNTWVRSWKRFMVDFCYGRGYVMIYPNLADTAALATTTVATASRDKDLLRDLRRAPLVNRKDVVPLNLPRVRKMQLRGMQCEESSRKVIVATADRFLTYVRGLGAHYRSLASHWQRRCMLDILEGRTVPESPGHSDKYLIYGPQMGLNNQLLTLVYAGLWGKILGRTTVVPHLFWPRSTAVVNSTPEEWVEYGEIYDLEHVRASHPEIKFMYGSVGNMARMRPHRLIITNRKPNQDTLQGTYVESFGWNVERSVELPKYMFDEGSISSWMGTCNDEVLLFDNMFYMQPIDIGGSKAIEQIWREVTRPNLQTRALIADGIELLRPKGALGPALDPETGLARHLCMHLRLGDFAKLCVGLGERGDACLVSEEILAEVLARTRENSRKEAKAGEEVEEPGVLVISDDAEAAAELVKRVSGGRRVLTSLDLAAMVTAKLEANAGPSPVRPNLIGILSATVDQGVCAAAAELWVNRYSTFSQGIVMARTTRDGINYWISRNETVSRWWRRNLADIARNLCEATEAAGIGRHWWQNASSAASTPAPAATMLAASAAGEPRRGRVVVVVSRPRDADRRAWMRVKLAAGGVTGYRVVDGIECRAHRPCAQQFAALVRVVREQTKTNFTQAGSLLAPRDWPPSSAMLGQVWTLMALLEMLLAESVEEAVILDDNIYLTPLGAELIRGDVPTSGSPEVVSQLATAPMYYLGASQRHWSPGQRRAVKGLGSGQPWGVYYTEQGYKGEEEGGVWTQGWYGVVLRRPMMQQLLRAIQWSVEDASRSLPVDRLVARALACLGARVPVIFPGAVLPEVRRLEAANTTDKGAKVLKQFGESRMINYRQASLFSTFQSWAPAVLALRCGRPDALQEVLINAASANQGLHPGAGRQKTPADVAAVFAVVVTHTHESGWRPGSAAAAVRVVCGQVHPFARLIYIDDSSPRRAAAFEAAAELRRHPCCANRGMVLWAATPLGRVGAQRAAVRLVQDGETVLFLDPDTGTSAGSSGSAGPRMLADDQGLFRLSEAMYAAYHVWNLTNQDAGDQQQGETLPLVAVGEMSGQSPNAGASAEGGREATVWTLEAAAGGSRGFRGLPLDDMRWAAAAAQIVRAVPDAALMDWSCRWLPNAWAEVAWSFALAERAGGWVIRTRGVRLMAGSAAGAENGANSELEDAEDDSEDAAPPERAQPERAQPVAGGDVDSDQDGQHARARRLLEAGGGHGRRLYGSPGQADELLEAWIRGEKRAWVSGSANDGSGNGGNEWSIVDNMKRSACLAGPSAMEVLHGPPLPA